MSTGRLAAVAAALVLARLIIYAVLLGHAPAATLCRWDCGWYTEIAAHGYFVPPRSGYRHPQFAWPFFPATPLLIALVRRASGLSYPACASLMASLCTIGIGLLGVQYRARTRAGARPSTWLALLVAMPFGVYFTTGYSEPPYVLLTLASLLALSLGRPAVGSLSCAVLGATRPTGILLAPAFALDGLRRAAACGSTPGRIAALLPAAVAVCGLLAWILYCRVAAGDPIAFVHAQSGWNRSTSDPARVLFNAIADGVLPGHKHGRGYEGLWAIVGLAVTAAACRARRWAEATLLGGTVLLALASGSVASMPRFVGASPVFLLALAGGIDRLGRPARLAALLVCAALQLLVLNLWVANWSGVV